MKKFLFVLLISILGSLSAKAYSGDSVAKKIELKGVEIALPEHKGYIEVSSHPEL